MELIGQMWGEIERRSGSEYLTMRCQRSGARCVGVDVENFACGTVGIQVCDCGGSGAALVQKDERYVVRLAFLYQRLSMVIRLSVSRFYGGSVAKYLKKMRFQ